MRKKHQFRPTGQWALEDRIALSHASAVVALATPPAPPQGLRANFTGQFRAKASPIPGGEDQASLNGSAQLAGLGNVKLAGNLASNPSLPPAPTNTNGVFLLNARRAGGVLTAVVTGPTTPLTSRTATTTQLRYTVVSAPPKLAAYIGTEGSAVLTLKPRRGVPNGQTAGSFTLRVVQS